MDFIRKLVGFFKIGNRKWVLIPIVGIIITFISLSRAIGSEPGIKTKRTFNTYMHYLITFVVLSVPSLIILNINNLLITKYNSIWVIVFCSIVTLLLFYIYNVVFSTVSVLLQEKYIAENSSVAKVFKRKKKNIIYVIAIITIILAMTLRLIYLLTRTKHIPDTNGEDTSVAQLNTEEIDFSKESEVIWSSASYTGGQTKSLSHLDYDKAYLSFGKASGVVMIQVTKATGNYSFEIDTEIKSGNCEVGIFEDEKLLYRYPANEEIVQVLNINEDNKIYIVVFCESAKGSVRVNRRLVYE